jgi:hypothetical protein
MTPKPCVLLLLLSGLHAGRMVLAHEGHSHGVSPAPPPSRVARIADSYRQRIQPLFERSCLDCHSSKTRYPWYARLPLVERLIASDIAEGRRHLDLEGGYPFKSHATPLDDLKAIREEIEKNEMPPARYRWLHPDRRLSEEEKKSVVAWTLESERILKGGP